MPVMNRVLNGKMNLDVSNYAVPAGDYIDAFNITRDSKGTGQDRIVANVPGNTLVSFTLPAGTNKVIGSFPDEVRNRIYIHVWNSSGNNLWLYFDGVTNTITKILEDLIDTANVPVLSYNPSKRINHIDIIYRDDDGDLYFFTDGNTTPKCANVKRLLLGEYGVVKSSFIETAKKPFLSPPTCVYGTDATRNANSLRKTLFQFTARPVYRDFQKATLSTYSKIPLPIGYYGSDNDTETTKNNFITVTVETGDIDVAKLEIFMRYNIGSVWSDFLQIASIDKKDLLIPDNSLYAFVFYNDGVYPTIEITEAIRLFDYVPPLADAQVMGNGNTPIYAAITEGYDNIPVSKLSVTLTVENVPNIPPDSNPPQLLYYLSGADDPVYVFQVTGSVPAGTVYTLIVSIATGFGGTGLPVVFATYTSVGGDTVDSVALALHNYAQANFPAYVSAYDPGAPDQFATILGATNTVILQSSAVAGTGGTNSTEKVFLPRCNYIFGIVYVDEQNRDIPGVTTFTNPRDSDNDFLVTTPPMSFSGATMETAVITAAINHLPPANAVAYYWVRRRMTYGSFLMYETCDFQEEDGHYYFCLANIEQYKKDNTQFVYATAPITPQTRIQVLAEVASGSYNGTTWPEDYEVLGVEKRTLTGGTTPADDRNYLKVKKPDAGVSPAYFFNMLVMVYEPLANPITSTDSVYFEWGEKYDIYSLGGVNYHRGKNQNQTASQPAISIWPEGDVYFHLRSMYNEILTTPYAVDKLSIMDAGFSDFFASSVNDNGRAQVVDVNARRQYDPVLVRFGHSFEAGTNINDVNRFDFLDFDEYDRARGAIRKLFLDKRRMTVFQQFDVGQVPVFTQIVRDTAGNPLEANSDQLLNKIAYPYQGKFGIGDVPESFAFGKGAMYFTDSNKGVDCRLAPDGITPISILYECNAFFVAKSAAFQKGLDNGVAPLGIYTGNPTIYGAFDSYINKRLISFEEINRYHGAGGLEAQTIPIVVDGANNMLVEFSGTVTPGVSVALYITASNGDAYNLAYEAVAGDSLVSIRNNLIDLINNSTTFIATVSDLGVLKGLMIHNLANATVSVTVDIIGQLYFHQDAYTLTFNETRDSMEGYESFMAYKPENMTCLNNLLVTFKNGNFWRHDSDIYNNFYAVQYQSTITPVFNDQVNLKKTFERISYQGNQNWVSDSDLDIITSLTNPQTGLIQKSLLRDFDFIVDEGQHFAALLRDVNSKSVALEGLYNGDYLVGFFIVVKMRCKQNTYSFINLPHIGFHLSAKNS